MNHELYSPLDDAADVSGYDSAPMMPYNFDGLNVTPLTAFGHDGDSYASANVDLQMPQVQSEVVLGSDGSSAQGGEMRGTQVTCGGNTCDGQSCGGTCAGQTFCRHGADCSVFKC